MTRYPIVLLDYDGTLAETRPAILRSLAEALRASGVEPPEPEALAAELARGATLGQLFRTLLPGADETAEAAFIGAYRAHYPRADAEETVLYDGVRDLVAGLREIGVRTVILSNKHRPSVVAGLERFGLTDTVSVVLGSEPEHPVKPDPRVMTERVRPLFPDARDADFLMVGDTVTDIRFAQNAGIAVCWVSYGHGEDAACRALRPDYEIGDIAELLPLLRAVPASVGQG